MSSPEDKMKEANKKNAEMESLRQLARNNKRNADENAEYERLFMLHRQEIIKNPELMQEKQKDVAYVVPEASKNDLKARNDLDAILKAYKATGREPVQTEHGMLLKFKNREEVVEFFKEQSKTRAFSFRCVTEDYRVYSDGKGTFVHGTNKQVSDYLKNPKDFKVGEDGKLDKKDESEKTDTYSSHPSQ